MLRFCTVYHLMSDVLDFRRCILLFISISISISGFLIYRRANNERIITSNDVFVLGQPFRKSPANPMLRKKLYWGQLSFSFWGCYFKVCSLVFLPFHYPLNQLKLVRRSSHVLFCATWYSLFILFKSRFCVIVVILSLYVCISDAIENPCFNAFVWNLFIGGYFHGRGKLTYGVDLSKIRWLGVLQVAATSKFVNRNFFFFLSVISNSVGFVLLLYM